MFLSVSVNFFYCFCLFLSDSVSFCWFLVQISVDICIEYYCISPKYARICPKYDWISPKYDFNCPKYEWIWYLFQPYGSGTTRSPGLVFYLYNKTLLTLSCDKFDWKITCLGMGTIILEYINWILKVQWHQKVLICNMMKNVYIAQRS